MKGKIERDVLPATPIRRPNPRLATSQSLSPPVIMNSATRSPAHRRQQRTFDGSSCSPSPAHQQEGTNSPTNKKMDAMEVERELLLPPPPAPSLAPPIPAARPPARTQSSPSLRAAAPTTQRQPLLGYSTSHIVLWVTYANIALYALCYQLQQPVIPFLVGRLSSSENGGGSEHGNSSARAYGRLESFSSAVQALGSPLVSALLDRAGIRKASAAVFLASACSYAILACATDMRLLFLSKVPAALQHAFLVAQATAAALSVQAAGAAATTADKGAAARAEALGRMTTAYTLGATIGPYLGGTLVERAGDLHFCARVAAAGSVVSVVLSLAFLPDTATLGRGLASHRKVVTMATGSPQKNNDLLQRRHQQRSLGDDLRHSASLAFRSSLWPLLLVKVIGGVSASMYATTVPLVLSQKLNYDPSEVGFSMSSAMLAVAIFGAFGIGRLIHLLSAPGVSWIALLCRCFIGVLLATVVSAGVTPTTYLTIQSQVLATNIMHGIATHALATSVTTQTTGLVDTDEQGSLLGLEHGLFSLARIGGPRLGVWLLATGVNGFWSVALACGGIDMALNALLAVTATQSAVDYSKSSRDFYRCIRGASLRSANVNFMYSIFKEVLCSHLLPL